MALERLVQTYKKLVDRISKEKPVNVKDTTLTESARKSIEVGAGQKNDVFISKAIQSALTAQGEKSEDIINLQPASAWGKGRHSVDRFFIGLASRHEGQGEKSEDVYGNEIYLIDVYDKQKTLLANSLHDTDSLNELMIAAQNRYVLSQDRYNPNIPDSLKEKLEEIDVAHPYDNYGEEGYYENTNAKEALLTEYFLQEADTMQSVLWNSYQNDKNKDTALIEYLNLLLVLSIESREKSSQGGVKRKEDLARQKNAGGYQYHYPLGSGSPDQVDINEPEIDFGRSATQRLEYLLCDRTYIESGGSKSLNPLDYNLTPGGQKLFLDIVVEHFQELSQLLKQRLVWLDSGLQEQYPGLVSGVNNKFDPSFEAFRAITAIYVIAEKLPLEERTKIFDLYRPFFAHPESPVRKYFEDIKPEGYYNGFEEGVRMEIEAEYEAQINDVPIQDLQKVIDEAFSVDPLDLSIEVEGISKAARKALIAAEITDDFLKQDLPPEDKDNKVEGKTEAENLLKKGIINSKTVDLAYKQWIVEPAEEKIVFSKSEREKISQKRQALILQALQKSPDLTAKKVENTLDLLFYASLDYAPGLEVGQLPLAPKGSFGPVDDLLENPIPGPWQTALDKNGGSLVDSKIGALPGLTGILEGKKFSHYLTFEGRKALAILLSPEFYPLLEETLMEKLAWSDSKIVSDFPIITAGVEEKNQPTYKYTRFVTILSILAKGRPDLAQVVSKLTNTNPIARNVVDEASQTVSVRTALIDLQSKKPGHLQISDNLLEIDSNTQALSREQSQRLYEKLYMLVNQASKEMTVEEAAVELRAIFEQYYGPDWQNIKFEDDLLYLPDGQSVSALVLAENLGGQLSLNSLSDEIIDLARSLDAQRTVLEQEFKDEEVENVETATQPEDEAAIPGISGRKELKALKAGEKVKGPEKKKEKEFPDWAKGALSLLFISLVSVVGVQSFKATQDFGFAAKYTKAAALEEAMQNPIQDEFYDGDGGVESKDDEGEGKSDKEEEISEEEMKKAFEQYLKGLEENKFRLLKSSGTYLSSNQVDVAGNMTLKEINTSSAEKEVPVLVKVSDLPYRKIKKNAIRVQPIPPLVVDQYGSKQPTTIFTTRGLIPKIIITKDPSVKFKVFVSEETGQALRVVASKETDKIIVIGDIPDKSNVISSGAGSIPFSQREFTRVIDRSNKDLTSQRKEFLENLTVENRAKFERFGIDESGKLNNTKLLDDLWYEFATWKYTSTMEQINPDDLIKSVANAYNQKEANCYGAGVGPAMSYKLITGLPAGTVHVKMKGVGHSISWFMLPSGKIKMVDFTVILARDPNMRKFEESLPGIIKNLNLPFQISTSLFGVGLLAYGGKFLLSNVLKKKRNEKEKDTDLGGALVITDTADIVHIGENGDCQIVVYDESGNARNLSDLFESGEIPLTDIDGGLVYKDDQTSDLVVLNDQNASLSGEQTANPDEIHDPAFDEQAPSGGFDQTAIGQRLQNLLKLIQANAKNGGGNILESGQKPKLGTSDVRLAQLKSADVPSTSLPKE